MMPVTLCLWSGIRCSNTVQQLQTLELCRAPTVHLPMSSCVRHPAALLLRAGLQQKSNSAQCVPLSTSAATRKSCCSTKQVSAVAETTQTGKDRAASGTLQYCAIQIEARQHTARYAPGAIKAAIEVRSVCSVKLLHCYVAAHPKEAEPRRASGNVRPSVAGSRHSTALPEHLPERKPSQTARSTTRDFPTCDAQLALIPGPRTVHTMLCHSAALLTPALLHPRTVSAPARRRQLPFTCSCSAPGACMLSQRDSTVLAYAVGHLPNTSVEQASWLSTARSCRGRLGCWQGAWQRLSL